MKLLETHTLTFSIPTANTLGTDGRWTEGTPTSLIVKGSLQSFKRGKKSLVLPEGISISDSRLFYTQTKVSAPDDIDIQAAPTTLINGKTFVIYDEEDNTGFNLKSNHYLYLLIRQDKLTAGGAY